MATKRKTNMLLGWLNLLMAQICIALMVLGVSWSIIYLFAAGILVSGLVLMALVKKPKGVILERSSTLAVKVAYLEMVFFGLLAIVLPVVNEFTAYKINESIMALSAIIAFYCLISATFHMESTRCPLPSSG